MTKFILKTFWLATVFFVFSMNSTKAQGVANNLIGAWETGSEIKMTKIYTDQIFAVTVYKNKEFVSTAGGKWKLNGKELVETFEFHSSKPEMVGTEVTTPVELKNGMLVLKTAGNEEEWKKLDDGTPGKLAGAWVITGRMTDGQFRKMVPGTRRTMKILSGTRFQWIAYNVETKEFSGTGGGTYTTENGKYVENILFFSRDNNRVGASLQFDFSIEDGNWRHKGLSSKGEPIDEVWTKREKIGL
jgi:hypothetical protein